MVDISNELQTLSNYAGFLKLLNPLTGLTAVGTAVNSGNPGQAMYELLFGSSANKQQPTAKANTSTTSTASTSQPARRNYGFTPDSIQGQIVAEAYNRGVDPALALAIAKQESGFNPNAMGDNNQSYGLFQIYSPAHPGYSGGLDPTKNIQYGVGLLASLNNKFGGDMNKVIQAYNAGAGAVSSGRIPNSTANVYLPNVLKFYNDLNGGVQNNQVPNTQTFNQSPPAASGSPVNYQSNISLPELNLIPVNGQSGLSDEFINLLRNLQQGGNANMNGQDVLNNINILSQIVGGAQQANQTPNLGATQSEAAAYQNYLNQMGQMLVGSNQQQDANQVNPVQALAAAYQQDAKNARLQAGIQALGNIAQGFLPTRRDLIFRDFRGNVIGQESANQRQPQVQANNQPTNAEMVANLLKVASAQNTGQAALEKERMQQAAALMERQAKLEQDIRVSQQTGLPLSIVNQMTPENYLTYIKPVQEGQQTLSQEAIKGINQMLNTNLSGQNTLANTALSNQGDTTNAIINVLGQLQNREMQETGSNQRANLAAQANLINTLLGNQGRMDVAQQQGANQLAVQQMIQQNPATMLNALTGILGVGLDSNSPLTPLITNRVLENLAQQYGISTEQQPVQNTTNSFWDSIRKLRK